MEVCFSANVRKCHTTHRRIVVVGPSDPMMTFKFCKSSVNSEVALQS